MAVRYPVLYLLSEIHNRDWDARLLIADYASALGATVVVGQQWVVNNNVGRLPPGLVLIRTINQIQMNVARVYAQVGHLVTAMDEEVLAVIPDQDYQGVIPPKLARVCDAFYANSQMHAEMVARVLPEMKDRILTVGNPRTDLLTPKGRTRFAAEAQKIREDVGPFILFNSNTAQENSIWTSKDEYLSIQVRAGAVNPDDPKSVETFLKQFEFEKQNSAAFMGALYWCLENVSSHRVVVRPHPVERVEFWHKVMQEHPRLHVAEGTHHIPWMQAADVVVHTNSTTGVESMLLDRPTVNLVPDPDGYWSRIFVGPRVNPTFTDWRDGMAALTDFLATRHGRLVQIDQERAELQRFFPNVLDGDAAKRIAKNMVYMLKAGGLSQEPFNIELHLNGRLPPYDRPDVLRRKFVKDFNDAVNDFQAIRQVTQLSHKVKIKKLAESCFAIEPQGA